MVYANTLESSNHGGARRRRAKSSAGGTLATSAHFVAAFCLMIVVAAALVAHGLFHACASALSDRAIRRRTQQRAMDQAIVPHASGATAVPCYY